MKELFTRAIFGALYVLIFITASLVSEYTFIGLFLFFGFICLHELQNLLKLNTYFSYFALIAFFMFFSIFQFDYYVLKILLILTIFIKILLLKDLFINRKIPLFERKKYLITLFYLISSVVFLTLIPYQNGIYTPEIIIGIFILVWVNDTFAYLVGKNFGKKKLFERISPNKTIEGFLGGLFFSLITGYIIYYYTSIFSISTWLVITIIVSSFGTLGDLIQSKLKRQAKVKDSGTLIPGHGGLLDRLDSILFSGTFVYAYLLIMTHVS